MASSVLLLDSCEWLSSELRYFVPSICTVLTSTQGECTGNYLPSPAPCILMELLTSTPFCFALLCFLCFALLCFAESTQHKKVSNRGGSRSDWTACRVRVHISLRCMSLSLPPLEETRQSPNCRSSCRTIVAFLAKTWLNAPVLC
jgi:hypothetical protein